MFPIQDVIEGCSAYGKGAGSSVRVSRCTFPNDRRPFSLFEVSPRNVRASREVRVEGLIIRGLVLTSFCFQPVGRSRGVPSRRRRRSDLSARVARRDASDTTRGPVASEHLPESSRDARIGGAATATASSRSRTRGGRSESVRAKEGARCVGSDRAIRTSW